MKRRQFLGCLTAAASSYVLVACGGGGASGVAGALSGNTGAVANASATASTNGTTVPPASSLTDSTGAVWTLSSGYIYKDGVKDAHSYNVKMLLWYNNYVYQQNTSGQFYQYTGSSWAKCFDPRLGTVSADGTVVPPAAAITDKLNNKWTLSNGYIYKNGVKDLNSFNVASLLWYGGMVYQATSSGKFYVMAFDGTWKPTADPRIAAVAKTGGFYGMNGHSDYPYTPTQIVAALNALGCTTYRVTTWNNALMMTKTLNLAKAFQGTKLDLFVCLGIGLRDANKVLYTSETAAYNAAFQQAAAVATQLAPYGVVNYECGNELTRDAAIVLSTSYAGTSRSCYNNTNWPILRGLMRGMIAGVKSVQPTARCGINFTVADIAASDMLWDGQQPDGTSGYPTVRWDITTWHNYEPYGDIFDIGSEGAGPTFNLPAYCKARYGVPFMITEWNANPINTETFRSGYVSQKLTEFYAARKTQGVESVMYYELMSGDTTYGIVDSNLNPLQPTWGTFQQFVAQHPDV